MKKTLLLFLLFTVSTFHAQVGIGTTSPDASAMLDVQSNNSGFAMPRMTTSERTGISNPVPGLQVYDTEYKNIWFYNGTEWRCLSAVAYGKVRGDGTANRIIGASVTRQSQGLYHITFDKKMPSAHYSISLSVRSDNQRRDLGIYYKNTNREGFDVYIYRSDNGSTEGVMMNAKFQFSVIY